ncbi:MAG: twin-arginine translocase TatA/TatE family subunit [Fuerstiella sp.]|jgi:sec-independent protein translocase protein TatA|nr:twin-arginine translocase TatA/TatE family subunit [Fuerstiella sp.]MDG2126717.1 twin-arginine translocase TatA/TatE family subunit [Fuerstiella sp.]
MFALFFPTASVNTLAFGFGGPLELTVIAGIVLVLFGNRLPGAAKSLGQSFSAFKKGIKEGAEDDETDNLDSE